LALGLAGEAGELANFVKKEWRDGDDRYNEIVGELVDCANYVAMIALQLGVEDLPAEMLAKLIAVEARSSWKAAHPK
jgi:NTP pyrophosphatase (non-canonical NTP hydrolase)